MSDTKNPWTTRGAKLYYDNRWIRVIEHDVLDPSGKPGIYGTVHLKNLAIGIVPIDTDGSTYLVGQFRYPFEKYSWEIPEGGGPRDVTPLDSAQRELIEETGLAAGGWAEVLRMDLSNSVSDEEAICFLAWDLTQGTARPEDTEQLQIKRVPFADALAMAWRGEITDSMSVAALLKVELMARRGELPAAVARLFVRP
ncbi:MAG: NUDIX hydrolase [Alphaproteobacteria bacterium]|nr:NUDIX hydrolase [Alphaproteobacteria bacterium]